MTLVRIIALSVLLGSAVAGVVWFAWGAIENVFSRRAKLEAEPAKDAKGSAKDAGPGKAA